MAYLPTTLNLRARYTAIESSSLGLLDERLAHRGRGSADRLVHSALA